VAAIVALMGVLKRGWNSLKRILSGKAAERTNLEG
jgi:hypothetical protein